VSASGNLVVTTTYSVPTTTGTLGTDTEYVSRTWSRQYAGGTASGQFDLGWSERRTLAGVPLTYDLTALTGPRGTVTFAHIIEVAINVITSTDPATLTLGGEGSANEWVSPFGAAGQTIKLRSLGTFILAAPDATAYAVGPTNRLFKVNPGASTVTYEILFKARSI
jgi:hypothetical protein